MSATCAVVNNSGSWTVSPTKGCSAVASLPCPNLNGSIVPPSVLYNTTISFLRKCAPKNYIIISPDNDPNITCMWKANSTTPTLAEASKACILAPLCAQLVTSNNSTCFRDVHAMLVANNWTGGACAPEGTWFQNGTYVGSVFASCANGNKFANGNARIQIPFMADIYDTGTHSCRVNPDKITLGNCAVAVGGPALARSTWLSLVGLAVFMVAAGIVVAYKTGGCKKGIPIGSGSPSVSPARPPREPTYE